MAAPILRFLFLIAAVPALAVRAPTFKLYDGTDIPALALGTWLGHTTKGQVPPSGDEVQRAVEWALAAGYRHVDTAWRYGIEDQVGRAIQAKLADGTLKRDELFVTTKLWNEHHSRSAVIPALRRSLASLRLDYVDLYLVHWPTGTYANGSADATDYLETWRGMAEAQAAGLARHIGLSNFNHTQVERVISSSDVRPAVLQVELNLNLQQPKLLQYCKSRGVLVMGYTPFGSLFPRRAAADAPPPRETTPEIRAVAAEHGKTVSQIALRYLYELGVIPIPKSVQKNRIEQNIDIFDFELTAADRALLRSYDRGYRTLPQRKWAAHPYYPFEDEKLQANV